MWVWVLSLRRRELGGFVTASSIVGTTVTTGWLASPGCVGLRRRCCANRTNQRLLGRSPRIFSAFTIPLATASQRGDATDTSKNTL